MHRGLHPDFQRLQIPRNEEVGGLINVKESADDENRLVTRYAVKTTKRLLKTAAEELNLVRYFYRI